MKRLSETRRFVDPLEMVDVSDKRVVRRTAEAVGRIFVSRETIRTIREGKIEKGDPFPVAEVAGILAAKKVSELIPLCHSIPLGKVDVSFQITEDYVEARCIAVAEYRTGVEMEALTGVSVALLNLWDMVKYLEKDEKGQYPTTKMTDIRVVEKRKESGEAEKHRDMTREHAGFAVVVTSDMRNEKTDETGRNAIKLIEDAGHKVPVYEIIANDKATIQTAIKNLRDDSRIDVILTSGGTGISSKDRTVEAVADVLDKKMEGFGELFRRLSHDEIGEATILSRAVAGIANGKLIFCLPGSRSAVELGLTKIILPSLGHMLWEARR